MPSAPPHFGSNLITVFSNYSSTYICTNYGNSTILHCQCCMCNCTRVRAGDVVCNHTGLSVGLPMPSASEELSSKDPARYASEPQVSQSQDARHVFRERSSEWLPIYMNREYSLTITSYFDHRLRPFTDGFPQNGHGSGLSVAPSERVSSLGSSP